MDIGVISRLWSYLSVVLFVLSEVNSAGFVKYLLKELAISLLVVEVVLKFMEGFRSLIVGSLLLRDLSVFQYVLWLCLWSHGASMLFLELWFMF